MKEGNNMNDKIVKKWIWKNGEHLTVKEYRAIHNYCSKNNIDFEKHLKDIGIRESKCDSKCQSPLNNTEKLVGWANEGTGGAFLLLTERAYKNIFADSKRRGVKAQEFLKEQGYYRYKIGKDNTSYINMETGELLTRKEYHKLNSKFNELRENETFVDFLRGKGYQKLLEIKVRGDNNEI